MKLSLVGDIGGTNARIAQWRDDQLHDIEVMPTKDYPSLEAAIQHYLAKRDITPGTIGSVCLALAGPVGGDEFKFTNNHWHISRKAFCAALQIDELIMVNDFTAMALGMTRLAPDELVQVCDGEPEEARPRVVIGPGTGLGVGTLLCLGEGRWLALPGEGGHVDLPVGDQREAQIWEQLQREVGHVSAESVLSGAGLVRLYHASCTVDGNEAKYDSPADITTAALEGDAVAAAVLDQFCCWLGRVAGNNVLTVGGRGGVYIAGGVIPRITDFFLKSGFARSFTDKGCMTDYFKGVPVWLVTAEYPGLNGAGVALKQASKE